MIFLLDRISERRILFIQLTSIAVQITDQTRVELFDSLRLRVLLYVTDVHEYIKLMEKDSDFSREIDLRPRRWQPRRPNCRKMRALSRCPPIVSDDDWHTSSWHVQNILYGKVHSLVPSAPLETVAVVDIRLMCRAVPSPLISSAIK